MVFAAVVFDPCGPVPRLLGADFPDGLGEQYLLSDYYQPCCFGVLLLMGIAAYNARRLAAAAGCFLLAPLFHPAYTLTAAMIVVALAVVPASRCVPAVRRWLFPAAVLALLALYAAWCIRALTSAPDVRLLAHRILADTRIPHHAHPATWDLAPVFTFFAVAGAAAWTARRRSVGQALGLLLSATAVLLAWTVLGDHATLAVLAPWRVSAVLAPLSWIVLVAAAANGFARWWPGPPPFTEPRLTGCIALATLLLCVVGVLGLVRDYRAKHARAHYAVTRFLSEYHEPGFLYVTPLAETHLRLEAGVPVYATWKSHPTRDSEFLIWYDRVQAVDAFYGGGTNAATVFRARLAPAGVTHVLWPASGGAFPLASAGRRLYRDEHYSLWDARTP